MRRRMRWIAMGMSLMMLSGLAGCSGNQQPAGTGGEKAKTEAEGKQTEAKQEPVKIRIQHGYVGASPNLEPWERLLGEFMEEHKDTIELDLEGIALTGGVTDYRNKLKLDLASDNLPDIFFNSAEPAGLAQFAESGALLDVRDYFKLSPTVKAEDYKDDSWFFVTVDDIPLAVPTDTTISFGMANKEIFDKCGIEIPTNYEEWRADAKILRENGYIPQSIGSKGGAPGHTFFGYLWGMFSSNDADAAAVQKGDFSGASIYGAAKAIETMRKDGIFPDDTVANGSWDMQTALYDQEKAALVWTQAERIVTFSDAVLDKSVVIAYPKIEGADVDPNTITAGGQGGCWCINKKSFEDPKKQAAMIEILDFLNSDKLHEEFTYKSGWFSAKNTVKIDKSKVSRLYGEVYDFVQGKKIVKYVPSVLPDTESDVVYRTALDELYAGIINADEFVQKVQAQLDKTKH